MNDTPLSQTDIARSAALRKERLDISSLPPQDALNRILDYHQPVALVHSLPEEDLYFLIHDIGPEDALPLLSLASARQLDFILDREIWRKDRMDNQALTYWFDLMMQADSKRFVTWLIREKIDLLEFYLHRNIEMKAREHDQERSDFTEDFFTFDNVLYIRIIEEAPDSESQQIQDEKRRDVLMKLLKGISFLDYSVYQNILFESAQVLPAEIEEEAFRCRNVRLEEKGFLPFDEAIGIYRPLDPGELVSKGPETGTQDPAYTVPMAPFALIRTENVFTHALTNILDEIQRIKLQEEFASLCNQIIVADQKEVQKKDDLRPVVKKACGYISIGMERIIGDGASLPDTVNLLLRHPLSHLFQAGYGRIWEMKRRVNRWVKDSWFGRKGLPLSFWGEEWLGVLGGVLLKRPLFFDNYRTGVLYRDFESMEELQRSEKIINDIITCDGLLFLMDIDISPDLTRKRLSYKNLLLTAWVKNFLGLSGEPALPSLDQFTAFFTKLWEGKGKRRKIRGSMKTDFLDFLARKTGLKDFEITHQAGGILEELFLEIESEYAGVSGQHLDPRFISLFLIQS
jgi:hypothetical protein